MNIYAFDSIFTNTGEFNILEVNTSPGVSIESYYHYKSKGVVPLRMFSEAISKRFCSVKRSYALAYVAWP